MLETRGGGQDAPAAEFPVEAVGEGEGKIKTGSFVEVAAAPVVVVAVEPAVGFAATVVFVGTAAETLGIHDVKVWVERSTRQTRRNALLPLDRRNERTSRCIVNLSQIEWKHR